MITNNTIPGNIPVNGSGSETKEKIKSPDELLEIVDPPTPDPRKSLLADEFLRDIFGKEEPTADKKDIKKMNQTGTINSAHSKRKKRFNIEEDKTPNSRNKAKEIQSSRSDGKRERTILSELEELKITENDI